VHVFVTLCDNLHQGIVPVRPELGDGQNPPTNLYWGALYGVETFLRRSPHWELRSVARRSGAPEVLERVFFESTGTAPKVFIVADAYDGSKMRQALRDFFSAASGDMHDDVHFGAGESAVLLRAGGRADLVCFVGHNGLMDMCLDEYPKRGGMTGPASAVVLACKSRRYFEGPLRLAGCAPLLTTTGLMAPEAYTLDAAIRSWAAGDPPETLRLKAGKAYAQYQRTSERAGVRLFATGWNEVRKAGAEDQ